MLLCQGLEKNCSLRELRCFFQTSSDHWQCMEVILATNANSKQIERLYLVFHWRILFSALPVILSLKNRKAKDALPLKHMF